MGAKSRAISISLSPQCGDYNRALSNERLLSLLYHVGAGGGGRQWLQMTGT